MWCPKCKIEYRNGVTVCADCGTPLVEGSEKDFDVVDICSLRDEQMADRFMDYLIYSKLDGAVKQYDKETGIYTVTVPTAQAKKAERLFEGFLTVAGEELEKEKELQRLAEPSEEAPEDSAGEEAEDTDAPEESGGELQEYDWDAEEQEEKKPAVDPFADDAEEMELGSGEESDDTPKELLYEPAKEYVKKEDAYKDMLFSGWTFILFGVAGFVYLILCQVDIIPIKYNIAVLVGIALMFALFLIGGIVSLVKSAKLKPQIPLEQEKTRKIKKWLKENLTEEIIEKWTDSRVSEAENDLLLMAHIRASLIKQYPEEDVAYLEMISEEYYTEFFVS